MSAPAEMGTVQTYQMGNAGTFSEELLLLLIIIIIIIIITVGEVAASCEKGN
jgi:hypothetical protein